MVAAMSFSVLSCKEDESNDLARAQKCLDEVSQSAPGDALNCLTYISKYTSQQAYILKCSIYMTSGGLMEDKMVKAYNAIDDQSNANREATFMSMLALTNPNASSGYDTAVTADGYCQSSGVPGLQYISGVVKIGSFMAKTMSSYGSVDFNDPAAVTTAVNDLISKCNSDPRDSSCPTDLSAIGSSVTVLASSYCTSANASSDVCDTINSTVDAAGGNSAAVGDALFCYLANKTYNTSTGKCNP